MRPAKALGRITEGNAPHGRAHSRNVAFRVEISGFIRATDAMDAWFELSDASYLPAPLSDKPENDPSTFHATPSVTNSILAISTLRAKVAFSPLTAFHLSLSV